MPTTRDSITDVWGERTPHLDGQWPVRVDERTIAEPERWVQSACVLCSNGCGLDIGVRDGRIVGVRGRAVDRVNRGRLGPKGLHGWEANHSPDRLTRPLIRQGGRLREASWDEAMGLVVQRAQETRDRYTSGALGLYDTGQLFLEEYYTLALIWHGGLGCNNMDGNTRLCTATAAQALKETFGSDGPPGSYTDFDLADCIFMVGHNMANTQTVLWSRVLDRRRSAAPPKLIVVDPRETVSAREADVHLAPRAGTNVALLNGLLHLLIKAGHVDRAFIEAHTTGFEEVARIAADYPPERVEAVTGVPEARLREAAHLLGTTPRLVSTVLQGVYQSNQATAAACQVNNINLVRGMIGKPGCTVFQMNGQPTAQNTRETGCNGEFPGFLNWQNPDHIRYITESWNIDPLHFPSWHLPMHAMEIFRHAELGSIRFLWVVCTNPAVSLPDLHRIRRILSSDGLFVVVQDAFLTETAELADVVLPAAIWGEKTGAYTNPDRTVHLSHKAVEPPGEARPDLDIFLDFARRMDFRDRDGAPLVKWSDARGAFDAFAAFTRGLLCDYSGLSHDKLTGGSGVQWPCNRENPDGTERLYTDLVFPTGSESCQEYGHDLETGGARPKLDYQAKDPRGRAILKGAHHRPAWEEPDESYPFRLTTGRVVHQFHTRTKTGRSPELQAAAPEAFAQIAHEDAVRLGVAEGDEVEVVTRRGTVRAPAKVGDITPGHVFVPFHYGTWDDPESRHSHAANELTQPAWDPVSKQPYFKLAAAQVRRSGGLHLGERLADAAGKAAETGKELVDRVTHAAHAERRRVADYLGLLAGANTAFAQACEDVQRRHEAETEIRMVLAELAELSRSAVERLRPYRARYGEQASGEPEALRRAVLREGGADAFGLLRDLHGLFLLVVDLETSSIVLMQCAKELRDADLLGTCMDLYAEANRGHAFLNTQIEHRASHTLVVPQ